MFYYVFSVLAGECPAPIRADFPLGTIQGADYSFQASISFNCRDGYELIGLSTLTCTKHDRWNGFFPTCEGTEGIIPMLHLSTFADFKAKKSTQHSTFNINFFQKLSQTSINY